MCAALWCANNIDHKRKPQSLSRELSLNWQDWNHVLFLMCLTADLPSADPKDSSGGCFAGEEF